MKINRNRTIPKGPRAAQTGAHRDAYGVPPHPGTVHPSPSPPTPPESRILRSRSKESLINHARPWIGENNTDQRRCLVDMLTDEDLLAIFYFCQGENETIKEVKAWQTLVHVCRRWRGIMFGSPRRLKLRLVCTSGTPARGRLGVWPVLPLVVQCDDDRPIENVDNIVAALECSSRVRRIHLGGVSSSHLEKIWVAMQEPFPELTHLYLWLYDETVPVLTDSFLGGSAPLLQFLELNGIPYAGLPKLLLSANHLVFLRLYDIPHSGYFSPEAMVTALSTLTILESLDLEFLSPQSRPNQASRRPPPRTRSVLTFLILFRFKGVGEYLDDLVARIDAPRLKTLDITFFNQIVFDMPNLIQFISRTPRLKLLEKARILFENGAARVKLSRHTYGFGELDVKIPCRELDWQVSSLEQVCACCLPPLSALDELYISEEPSWQSDWQDNIENTLWLELLHPFTAVKNLYLSEEFAWCIVSALQELVGGRMTGVLPNLENIFLEGETSGPVQEGIQQFVVARQASHHIAVSRWYRSRSRRPAGTGDRQLINTVRYRPALRVDSLLASLRLPSDSAPLAPGGTFPTRAASPATSIT